MQIQFVKYQGAGNDFIIIDNRNSQVQLNNEQVHMLCDRRFGIGADGLMLLNKLDNYDFEMVYYNADGALGSMCGNGGRCITQFAYDLGIHKENYHFLASDGPHEAFFGKNNWIHLKMKNVDEIAMIDEGYVLDTGSPHYIKEVDDVAKIDVVHKGQAIRYNDKKKKKGINVNFVQVEHNKIIVRT
ncbi:MAG: diaminopimelate epimerase, partial [Sphingobacteriia bacterium]